jgi:uncharacterized protein (TIGR02588 family)
MVKQQAAIEQPQNQRPSRSLAEWVTLSIASLLLGTIAGLVVYSGVTRSNQPPIMTISRPEPTRQENGQFYVPFEIANTGGETAESVQVIAELKQNGRVELIGDVQIEFLAGGETAQGAFVINQNPQVGELVLRVGSYRVP